MCMQESTGREILSCIERSEAMFTYRLSEHQGEALVTFTGDIDIDGTETIEEKIVPALGSYQKVEIDFSGVHFVDSSGIGLLIGLVQTLKEKGRTVQFRRIKPEVWEVFELLQLHEILGNEVFPK
jgi:anti-sigma B factor antagonist